MSKTLNLALHLFLIVPIWCRLDEDVAYSSISVKDECPIKECFHQPATECLPPESKCRCRLLSCRTAAVCCDVNKFQLAEGLACANITVSSRLVEAIHIRNATMDALTVDDWKKLKHFRYVSITDGHIKSVTGEIARQTLASCLNLSSNGIVTFENRSLVNLHNLNFLDLSRNNLSDVPRVKIEGPLTLDISDNKNMLCSNVQDALNRKEIHFRNLNKSFCSVTNVTNYWFKANASLEVSQVIRVHELGKVCPPKCSCQPSRILFVAESALAIVAMSVNCTGLNLTSLPTFLPSNTVRLNVSNNLITSLDLFKTDPSYATITNFIADNNQIESVLPLEGSKFIGDFNELSLRNNKLKSLPTYIFSNTFDRTNSEKVAQFGGNNLTCDCNTAKVLKVWLRTKQKYIPDYEEVRCKNMDMKVVELDTSKLCQSQKDWTGYIYYIITAEVLLLLGLIAKVVYDYCIFKTSGYLPWPANKMPKLPCDWLCE